ncbi:FkbM family methyltransferase [Paroceanicella profunda]|uniref:FkbM family methyltransferase n=1 Tax=Paroceanicella profunda TaxID=2579971 RepID=A0A5B8FWC5_9RHOB|nr:FkbM family methyltransferase [Paroceanicella profunda]QDL91804.1 FkbM family methyltransferase [Paroceanicella profunda]
MSDISEELARAREVIAEAERRLRAAIRQMPDSPRRGRLAQERWALWQMLGRDRPYFSQAGQDEFLDRTVFRRKRGGVFVEVGAYDGITGSNTAFFEAFRGWTGLLVEAAPHLHAQVCANRASPCLNLAVAAQEGEADFLDIRSGYVQMGGLLDTLGAGARAAIEADSRTRAEVIRVPTRPLADILSGAGLRRIDYISIDIEGGEEAVLAAFPFARFEIAAWSIEVNEASPAIAAIMDAAGYRLAAHVGVDQIWLHKG